MSRWLLALFMLGGPVALAGEAEAPADEPEQGAPADEGPHEGDVMVEEVFVYGELMVEQARQEVIREARRQGYSIELRRGDALVLRHPEAWRGEIFLHDDGWVRMKRQPVRVEPPGEGAMAWLWCVFPQACLRPGGQLVGRRKFQGVKGRALVSMQHEIEMLGDRVADHATDQRVSDLPERLYALWEQGVPLEGEARLDTPEARRQALLAYWESRTDTEWGDRVRLAVEAFLRAEVQQSPYPVTPEEVEAVNARRHGTRALDLHTPWAQVVEAFGEP